MHGVSDLAANDPPNAYGIGKNLVRIARAI